MLWSSSGYKPDMWGKPGRPSPRKGVSKYNSLEEREEAWRLMRKEWRDKNRDKMREYQRKYNHSERGQYKHRMWMSNHVQHLKQLKHRDYIENKERYREKQRDWRAENGHKHKQSNIKSKIKALSEMEENYNDSRHGTYTGYVYGCRCGRCRQAAREYRRMKNAS